MRVSDQLETECKLPLRPADRRHFDDLMTPRLGIISREGRLAMGALLWLEHHHLIDFFHRYQGVSMARVTRLSAATSLTPRATCLSVLWRIARRWA